RPPTDPEKRTFVNALKKLLTPFVTPDRSKLLVERVKTPTPGNRVTAPFDVLVLGSNGKAQADIGALADDILEKIIDIADETGATQIVVPETAGLVVGIYNQYRYWTLSRARLLSGDIIRN